MTQNSSGLFLLGVMEHNLMHFWQSVYLIMNFLKLSLDTKTTHPCFISFDCELRAAITSLILAYCSQDISAYERFSCNSYPTFQFLGDLRSWEKICEMVLIYVFQIKFYNYFKYRKPLMSFRFVIRNKKTIQKKSTCRILEKMCKKCSNNK